MNFERRRRRMVSEQLAARGVGDPRVLDAFGAVPRHAFIEPGSWPDAYEDRPVSIGLGQTISQPFIVGWMAQLLEFGGAERVLEAGTGSGYAAAILGRLAAEVFTVELEPSLCARARAALHEIGASNVRLREGNGLEGWPDAAPFDRIMASAALSEVPPALLAQLKPGGWFLGPVGPGPSQLMTKIRRCGDGYEAETLGPVLFVPMRRSRGEGA